MKSPGLALVIFVFTVIAFALSWLLKEVPLRTALHGSAELSAEEAVAGGAPPAEIVESDVDAKPAG